MERVGFPMVFMSGLAVSATRLAAPDAGLFTVPETDPAAFASRIGDNRRLVPGARTHVAPSATVHDRAGWIG